MRRGTEVESVHRGALVVVRSDGQIAAEVGDGRLRSFARSAIKPLQALPLVSDGAVDRFEFSLSELAVVCGSHSGEEQHVTAVRSILRKVGLTEASLQCGVSFPLHGPTAQEMRARGEVPSAVHDNCSGKHAGMLALARFHGWPVEDYFKSDHPVQQRVREALEAAAGTPAAVHVHAVDGCGVPTYYVGLRELATAFARLADPESLSREWRAGAQRVAEAMMRFPEMVGGTERLDTVLMNLAPGRLVAKSGGEAIYAVGLPAQAMGLAMKIEDGASRAIGPVVIEALLQLGVLRQDDGRTLAPFHRPPVLNRRGSQVGEIVAAFELTYR